MIAETASRKLQAATARRQPKKSALEHDLPLLAATLTPTVRIDWAPLIDRGVTPSLPLGAERRLRGPR